MKKTVLVIFGGESSEYEVSLMSSSFIFDNIDTEKYDVIALGITKEGKWLLYNGDTQSIKDGTWVNNNENVSAFLSPDKNTSGVVALYPDKTEIIKVDVIWPMLHGKNGEDGTLQGLFKLSGIPYIGCDTTSSAVCMDKAMAHSLLNAVNIKQTNYLWFYHDSYVQNPDAVINKVCARLNFPLFVKPANAGSSVGVSKVVNADQLNDAIEVAAKEDVKILVEEGIVGKEIECAVLGGRDAAASPVGEICAAAEFYDYDDKYKNGVSKNFIPARIDDEVAEIIRKTAIRAYKTLGCAGLSRVDFFVTNDNEIYLNEINTLPGFTEISMYPKLWLSTGVSKSELIDKLIDTAYNRYEL